MQSTRRAALRKVEGRQKTPVPFLASKALTDRGNGGKRVIGLEEPPVKSLVKEEHPWASPDAGEKSAAKSGTCVGNSATNADGPLSGSAEARTSDSWARFPKGDGDGRIVRGTPQRPGPPTFARPPVDPARVAEPESELRAAIDAYKPERGLTRISVAALLGVLDSLGYART